MAFVQTDGDVVIALCIAIAINCGRVFAALTGLILPGDPGIVTKLRNGLIVGIGTFIAAKTVEAVERAKIGFCTRVVHAMVKIVIAVRFGRAALFIAEVMAVAGRSIVSVAIALGDFDTAPF